MFFPTDWKDQVTDESSGEVMQKGTDLSAANLNHLENGAYDANLATSLMTVQLASVERNLNVETHTVTLKNTKSFPFNNSIQTVALDAIRSNTSYEVTAECTNDTGWAGQIIISDKLINGFKVAYTGSAPTAEITLKIKGGF